MHDPSRSFEEADQTGRLADLAHNTATLLQRPLTGAGVITAGVAATYAIAREFSEAVPHFDRPAVAILGLGVIAAGTAITSERRDAYKEARETAVFPDPDMHKSARKNIKRQGAAAIAGAGLFTAVLAGTTFNAAKPYTEESHLLTTNITAILDVGADEYIPDALDTTTGENRPRVEVAANSIIGADDFFQQGSTINFIAAGNEVRGLGTIKVTTRAEIREDQERIIEGANINLPFMKSSGPSELEDALRSNEAQKADKIVVVSSNVSELPKSLFKGEAEPGTNRISIISLGGSNKSSSDNESPQKSDSSVAENLVGAEDNYHAKSSEDMTDIVNGIANSQFVETEQHSYNGFEKVRNLAATMLIGGYGISLAIASMRRRMDKRKSIRS